MERTTPLHIEMLIHFYYSPSTVKFRHIEYTAQQAIIKEFTQKELITTVKGVGITFEYQLTDKGRTCVDRLLEFEIK